MTVAVLAELKTKYTKELRLFKEYYDVDKSVKAKIQQYIPEKFCQTLKNKITSLSQVRTLSILTHLWTTYGSLKEEDVQDFDKNLKTAISADTCFEDFVAQIEDKTDDVSTQNPYSPVHIVSIAYTIVNATGFYSLDCKTWRHKPAIDQTWVNFKIFFAEVFKDVRDDGLTAQTSGYAVNVRQLQEDEVTMSEMQQETATALENIATATTSDRTSFITLTTTNSDLAKQITTLTSHLVAAQAKIATMTGQLATKTGGRVNSNNNSIPSTGNLHGLDPKGYCWTHGWRVRKGHSSYTCSNQNPGHNTTSIRENTKGGSTYNQGWKGEWPGQGGNYRSINNANLNSFTLPSIVPNGSAVENPTKQCISLAISDTGTNGNFFPSSTKFDDIKLSVVSLPVKITNGTIIHSTHTGLISNDSIPLAAIRAHLFKELYQDLISIGFFCYNGCMALFDDTQVVISNKETKEILMKGPRNTLTGLYMLDLEQKIKQPKIMTELEIPDTFFSNHVYKWRSKQNLDIYYHLTLFSPPVSIWVKAIKIIISLHGQASLQT